MMAVNQRLGAMDETSVTTDKLHQLNVKIYHESELVDLHGQSGLGRMTPSFSHKYPDSHVLRGTQYIAKISRVVPIVGVDSGG